MSWLAIVIVCLSMAMIIGPIMIMQPTSRQRNLAKLRTKAAKMGLRVHMLKLRDDAIAAYELRWPFSEKVKKRILSWQVEKMSYEHDIHLARYWHVSGEQALPAELQKALPAMLAKLPEGVRVVEVTRVGVRCYWNERGGEQTLQALAAWMDEFVQFMEPYIPRPSLDSDQSN